MRRFGLIGKTLKHSFSKGYFHDKFTREGIIDCEYENYELPSIGLLETLIKENLENSFKLLSTLPEYIFLNQKRVNLSLLASFLYKLLHSVLRITR